MVMLPGGGVQPFLTSLRHLGRMPNYRRPRLSGAKIFFTVTLADRDSDLLVRQVDLLRTAVRRTRAERPFAIEAWVVLPDHMHCIWQMPDGDSDYPTRWRLIKSRFSRQLDPGPRRPSHIRRAERGIWQRRYWEHHIRSDSEFHRLLEYCWANPVKHGLVDTPHDWQWSSIHSDARCPREGPNAVGKVVNTA